MHICNLKLIKKIGFTLLFSIMLFWNPHNLLAQQVEVSGGLTQKLLLGKQRNIYKPALGYEFGLNHHINVYRSAHSLNYGFNLGFYKLNRINSEEGINNQFQQLFETKALFRYDYFISNSVSLFSGGEVGFQFINLKSDQKVVISSESTIKGFTQAILSPQLGVNFEFTPYLALYYKFSYDLGYYLGDQPNWGSPSSKWNHLMTNSAGVRIKLNNGFY